MKHKLLTWESIPDGITLQKEYTFIGSTYTGFTFLDDNLKSRSINHGTWEKVEEYKPDAVTDKAPLLTGGSSDYYKTDIKKHHMIVQKTEYTAECNDIIEALQMNFAEGNAFKALWRKASARQGNGKSGTTALYDAEKVKLFGERLVQQES